MDRSFAPFTQSHSQLLQQIGRVCREQGLPASAELGRGRWVRRFLAFAQPQHPLELGSADVASFLAQVAAGDPPPGALRQACVALTFFYRHVLATVPPWLAGTLDAALAQRPAAGLTPMEVKALLGAMPGAPGLLCTLIHATGMPLLDALRLRVGDVRIVRDEVLLRARRRGTEHVAALPCSVVRALQAQLAAAGEVHRRDTARGIGAASAHRVSTAAQAWLFPDTTAGNGPRSASVRRHHLAAAAVRTAITLAAPRAGIHRPCTPQLLRQSMDSPPSVRPAAAQGTSTVQPVVLRASRSRCAWATSASG